MTLLVRSSRSQCCAMWVPMNPVPPKMTIVSDLFIRSDQLKGRPESVAARGFAGCERYICPLAYHDERPGPAEHAQKACSDRFDGKGPLRIGTSIAAKDRALSRIRQILLRSSDNGAFIVRRNDESGPCAFYHSSRLVGFGSSDDQPAPRAKIGESLGGHGEGACLGIEQGDENVR